MSYKWEGESQNHKTVNISFILVSSKFSMALQMCLTNAAQM